MDNKDLEVTNENIGVVGGETEVTNTNSEPVVPENNGVEQQPTVEPVSQVEESVPTPEVSNEAPAQAPETPNVVETPVNPQTNEQPLETPTNPEMPKMELNGQEQVVYEYKVKKDFGVWPYLIVFIMVVGIIYYLPDIQEKVKSLKGNNVATTTSNQTSDNTDKPTTPETPQTTYYEVSEETIISIDKLTLSNFGKETNEKEGLYYLTFDIENKDNKPYNYNEKIYIQAFTDNGYLSSILLDSNNELKETKKEKLKLAIPRQTYNSDFKMLVKKMSESDYPEVDLNTNEKGQEVLRCHSKNRTTIYTFNNKELVEIDDKIYADVSNYSNYEEYSNSLDSINELFHDYNNVSAVSANLYKTDDSFKLDIIIDPVSITDEDLTSLKEHIYYKGGTKSKTIAFEMVSRGNTCI